MSTPVGLPPGDERDALEVAASRPKRPTRRGRGGGKKEEKDPRIEIPCLKFKIKDNGDKDWGTLKDLKCTTTYEVKIVGIKGRTTTDTTLRSVICLYPGADDRLVPGESLHWCIQGCVSDARQRLLGATAPEKAEDG